MEDRANEDRQLVQSVLDGDSQAYAGIVTRYQKMIASVAWRYGARREEIEDVVSEVFIKAYGNLSRYRPDHPFSTWLYRLAANHVVDHGRRARKERNRVEMPEQVVDTSPSTGDELETDERSKLLRESLETLPDHYREVLFLVYVEEMKVDEAAETLKLPTGTIKTRLMRGRAALKKVLARRHPDYFGD